MREVSQKRGQKYDTDDGSNSTIYCNCEDEGEKRSVIAEISWFCDRCGYSIILS